jgi:hypothetical protein
VLLPAALMAAAGLHFWGRCAPNWPVQASRLFLRSRSLVSLLIGLLAPGGAS